MKPVNFETRCKIIGSRIVFQGKPAQVTGSLDSLATVWNLETMKPMARVSWSRIAEAMKMN